MPCFVIRFNLCDSTSCNYPLWNLPVNLKNILFFSFFFILFCLVFKLGNLFTFFEVMFFQSCFDMFTNNSRGSYIYIAPVSILMVTAMYQNSRSKVFLQNSCSEKFLKIQKKIPTPSQMFSLQNCFIKHTQLTASAIL